MALDIVVSQACNYYVRPIYTLGHKRRAEQRKESVRLLAVKALDSRRAYYGSRNTRFYYRD